MKITDLKKTDPEFADRFEAFANHEVVNDQTGSCLASFHITDQLHVVIPLSFRTDDKQVRQSILSARCRQPLAGTNSMLAERWRCKGFPRVQ